MQVFIHAHINMCRPDHESLHSCSYKYVPSRLCLHSHLYKYVPSRLWKSSFMWICAEQCSYKNMPNRRIHSHSYQYVPSRQCKSSVILNMYRAACRNKFTEAQVLSNFYLVNICRIVTVSSRKPCWQRLMLKRSASTQATCLASTPWAERPRSKYFEI